MLALNSARLRAIVEGCLPPQYSGPTKSTILSEAIDPERPPRVHRNSRQNAICAEQSCSTVTRKWSLPSSRGVSEPPQLRLGLGRQGLRETRLQASGDPVAVPVIAAGGIADARGIAGPFALGAAGVQIGSACMHCPEAKISAMHRAALKSASDAGTALSWARQSCRRPNAHRNWR